MISSHESSGVTPVLLPYGDDAVLVELAGTGPALALTRALRSARLPGVVDVVTGARTVLVRFALGARSAGLDGQVTRLAESAAAPAEADSARSDHREPVLLPVVYDGPDLDAVAAHLHTDPDEVVRRHTGGLWTVGFCGFAPGFGYLYRPDADGRPARDLTVPRRPDPRTRVPAGAVGLADHWSGVYPRQGPGGWQLIGRCSTTLWDVRRDPPALLQPGRCVRFVPAGVVPAEGSG